jgi:O-antigen ligase
VGRRDRISLALCAAALGIAIFAIGGAPRWAQAIVAALTCAAVVSTAISRRAFEARPPLLLLFAAMAAWSAFQWLPLPSAIAELALPQLHELRQDGAELVGIGVRSSLSVDPPGTLRGVTFFVTLMGVALVALRLSASERGRYALHACVALATGLAAVVVGLHELFDAHALYGLYTPRLRPVVMGPLINTNHLGCLFAIGAMTNLGLAFYVKQPSWRRITWATLAASCVAGLLATLSRGAILGVALGGAVLITIVFAQRVRGDAKRSRRRRERLLMTTAPFFVIATCGVIVTIYLAADTAISQVSNISLAEVDVATSKFAAWESAAKLVEEAPWTGVGRGAFEPAFTRIHPASALATFANPENIIVQAVTEWGIPAALAIGGVLVWLLLRAIRRWHTGPLAAGALGALMAVLFQSNFDFGIEMLGIAIPTTILVATLTYVPLVERVSRPRAHRIARLAIGLGCAAGALLLVVPATRTVDEDHDALRSGPTRASSLAAIERHPLDYLAFGVLAEQMIREREPGAVRVLNHALRLHPTHAGLHRLAARLLHQAKLDDQAASEYHTALRYSPDPRPLLDEIASTLPLELAARSIPIKLDMQRTTQHLMARDDSRLAILWLRRVLVETNRLRAAELLYTLAMKAQDLETAELAVATRCEQLPSTGCQLDRARLLSTAKRPREVVQLLREVSVWTGRKADKLAAWSLLCDAHVELGALSDAIECLRRLDTSGLINLGDPSIARRILELRQRQDAERGSAPPPSEPRTPTR